MGFPLGGGREALLEGDAAFPGWGVKYPDVTREGSSLGRLGPNKFRERAPRDR